MGHNCTEERFLNDVSSHSMEIIKDDGIYRHIKFSKNGSQIYRFDLHTWPGELCITGDCGTYVFRRLTDMFQFFRDTREGLYINPGYWGEKLMSIGTNAGYREFDDGEFKERVTNYYEQWIDAENPTKEEAEELWQEISENVLSRADYGEIYAYEAADSFEHNGFVFQDFFDGGGTERYTFSFIWCLYAIAWGIKQYDRAKVADAA